MGTQKVTALVILDGFGYRAQQEYNAIAKAGMRRYQQWLTEYPHVLLAASGKVVGLLEGMPGNSLVGHMALGTGRVVAQPITAINQAIDDGSFFKNELLLRRFDELRASGRTLHLIGLVSDGASHSHEKHLHALLRFAHQRGITKIVVHAFLDGRDVLPRSAEIYLQRLEEVFAEIGCGVIGSIHGRAYPMDRNERQEFISQSFAVLTSEQPVQYASWQEALQKSYAQGLRDEIIPPVALVKDAYIHDGDAIVFFNIRADRARSLTRLFFAQEHPRLLWMITGIKYYPECPADVLFTWDKVDDGLLDVLERARKTLFVIAEKEKYAHVTYFFNGGREVLRTQETRVIVPSIAMEKFEQHPQMSAIEITDEVLRSLTTKPCDFYLINYANPDMIGHTGNFDATVTAVTCVDEQLDRLYNQIVEKMQGTLYIVADHGKAEDMFDTVTQQPRTAHTTNPVWFLMIDRQYKNNPMTLPLQELADVAPFILQTMGLEVPKAMRKSAKS